MKTVHELIVALRPFVESYERAADHVGDSDLYNEQPRSVEVTIGECRRAAMTLHHAEQELKRQEAAEAQERGF